MKLSVIIPVYQSAGSLERCVHSITVSTCPDMEMILVDDGSTDGGGVICDRLAESDGRIRVIHRQNGGLSAARNTGIDAAFGDYITFVDSDDEIIPATLSDNMDYIRQHPETDLLEYPVTVHYGSKRQYNLNFRSRTVSGNSVFQDWISNEGYTHSYAWNKIFRKELFDSVRFPEGETFEDVAVCPTIISQCRCIHYSDTGLYLYYDNSNGITADYRFNNQEPLFRYNMKLLSEIIGMNLHTDSVKLWTVCLNLLIDLFRCADTDRSYTDEACVHLSALRVPLSCLRGSHMRLGAMFKYLAACIFGVKSVCIIAAACKSRL